MLVCSFRRVHLWLSNFLWVAGGCLATFFGGAAGEGHKVLPYRDSPTDLSAGIIGPSRDPRG